ncbi:MAG: hypothetical protein KAH10_00770 [Flavobacteriales bacterium]|nr:hypothetical protein [Flavobacteriales bacterium]
MTTMTQTIVGAGSITKKEKLRELNTKLFNTTVLEVQEPYPGYFSDIPMIQSINSVFLLVQDKFYPECILRASSRVKASLNVKFDVAYSRLSFGVNRDTHIAIRLVDLKKYEDIKLIQQAFSDAGIEFEPEIKLDLSLPVIININRVFSLTEVSDGIYKNVEMPGMSYLLFDKGGNWDWFEKMTIKVKNNFHRRNFDAAHGVIFRKGSLIEMVRIFDDRIGDEELIALKKLYNLYS